MKQAIALAIALASAQSWAATIIQNGSFETFSDWDATCPAGPTQCAQFNAGNSGLAGWTVGAGGVDVVGTPWPAADGSYSLDLNAESAGSISQSFSTTPNQSYRLSFELGANYLFAPPYLTTKVGTLSVGNLIDQVLSFSNPTMYAFPGVAAPMGWETMTFDFVATGSETTLTFTGLNAGAAGLALDNVSVSAIPEPSALALTLAGLVLLGVVTRQRAK